MSPEQRSAITGADNSCRLDLGGATLRLLADRAVYLERERCLLLADLHLGKGDAFRRAGIALPRGGTALDLQRISDLIARVGATQVIVLGDLIHGPLPADAHWRAQWRGFLEQHADTRFAAVLGNHDRALRSLKNFDGIELLAEGTLLGGLQLHHEPPESESSGEIPVLCGHLHPVLRLRQPGLPPRLPAFWLRGQRLVLPAFSAFTGGFALRAEPCDRLWLCAGETVLPLSSQQGAPST